MTRKRSSSNITLIADKWIIIVFLYYYRPMIDIEMNLLYKHCDRMSLCQPNTVTTLTDNRSKVHKTKYDNWWRTEEQRPRWCIRVVGHTLRSVGAIKPVEFDYMWLHWPKGYRVHSLYLRRCVLYTIMLFKISITVAVLLLLIIDPNENLRSFRYIITHNII